ncbi:MAG: hypothetical protein OFPI_29310 [Osedax symbiont Rs2]|nr:MAG: hypothetical protein OFPI_29310 [Osedax symbiont Rs2]
MTPIGKVISLTNTAVVQGADGEQWKLYINNNIFAGDKIVTGENDYLEIQLINDSRVVLQNGQSWTPTLETFSNSSEFSHLEAIVPGFCKGDANPSEQLLQLILLDKVTGSRHCVTHHAKTTTIDSHNRFATKRSR